jgi:hypothetical protein
MVGNHTFDALLAVRPHAAAWTVLEAVRFVECDALLLARGRSARLIRLERDSPIGVWLVHARIQPPLNEAPQRAAARTQPHDDIGFTRGEQLHDGVRAATVSATGVRLHGRPRCASPYCLG